MDKRAEIPSGKTFGRWTVLGPELQDGKERRWLCRCTCGTERYVARRSLVSGGSQSCGCLRNERVHEVLAYDLTGQVFGALTVAAPVTDTAVSGVRWKCRCICGKEQIVAATLLVTGKKTHCGCKTERGRPNDITGQRFGRLTAVAQTDERDTKGSVIWRCTCDCGKEVFYSYNTLLYTPVKSCGCQKREHDKALGGFLTRVDGTSVDLLKSKKTPCNNTTGIRGVYKTLDRYGAKITFQKKAYYLGVYDTLEEAAEARKQAEHQLNDRVVSFYEAWCARAEQDPAWATENPVRIRVEKQGKNFSLNFQPKLVTQEEL